MPAAILYKLSHPTSRYTRQFYLLLGRHYPSIQFFNSFIILCPILLTGLGYLHFLSQNSNDCMANILFIFINVFMATIFISL